MSQLVCRNLTLGYEGRVVVSDLNFAVNRGDYLCVVGENGSGKSTLLRTLLHLQTPMAGELIFGDGVHRGEIGYLPQQTAVQRDFPASVREIVLSGCAGQRGFHPFYSRKDRVTAEENMEKFSVADLAELPYRTLSGGQQQRVLLARALCATKKMLLLDEPVAGLDPAATESLYRCIEGLNQNEGITILMISHDMEAAVHYATHILHIGKPVFFGTTSEYLASPYGRRFSDTENGARAGETSQEQ